MAVLDEEMSLLHLNVCYHPLYVAIRLVATIYIMVTRSNLHLQSSQHQSLDLYLLEEREREREHLEIISNDNHYSCNHLLPDFILSIAANNTPIANIIPPPA
jgi:hypothetical protein